MMAMSRNLPQLGVENSAENNQIATILISGKRAKRKTKWPAVKTITPRFLCTRMRLLYRSHVLEVCLHLKLRLSIPRVRICSSFMEYSVPDIHQIIIQYINVLKSLPFNRFHDRLMVLTAITTSLRVVLLVRMCIRAVTALLN